MEDVKEKLESIREHKKNNEVVFMTSEGAVVASIDKLIKQPIEGLLYDLNRDYATLSAMAESSKSLRWVNDMALVNILEYVLKENSKLRGENEILEKELEETKTEFGKYSKNPFECNTTPIPTRSTAAKPTVQKPNANAFKITPGLVNTNFDISM